MYSTFFVFSASKIGHPSRYKARGEPYYGKGTLYNGNIPVIRGTLHVIRPTPSRYKVHPGPYNGKVARFLPLKKVKFIMPGPSIRYKARALYAG